MLTIIATVKSGHLQNILSGEKQFEIRKTAPKERPFRVLLCESKSGGRIRCEFVCDQVLFAATPEIIREMDLERACCVSLKDIEEYANGRPLYLWHISQMINYHHTKGHRVRNVCEFGLKRAPQSWQTVKVCDPES